MRPRAILAVVRKDALDLLLNKSTLGGLLAPILLSLVWHLIINVIGNRPTDVLVHNPGNSNVVQAVMATLTNPEVTQASSAGEVSAAFETADTNESTSYAVGLIVPADFDDGLRAGTHPQL